MTVIAAVLLVVNLVEALVPLFPTWMRVEMVGIAVLMALVALASLRARRVSEPRAAARPRTRLSPEARRDALVAAAVEVLAARGYAATTAEAIAVRAGVSKGGRRQPADAEGAPRLGPGDYEELYRARRRSSAAGRARATSMPRTTPGCSL